MDADYLFRNFLQLSASRSVEEDGRLLEQVWRAMAGWQFMRKRSEPVEQSVSSLEKHVFADCAELVS